MVDVVSCCVCIKICGYRTATGFHMYDVSLSTDPMFSLKRSSSTPMN